MSGMPVYECEMCGEQLAPQAHLCPRCGMRFETPVPADAAPPACPVHPHPRGTSAAARATVILSHSPIPTWLPTLRRLSKRWIVY